MPLADSLARAVESVRGLRAEMDGLRRDIETLPTVRVTDAASGIEPDLLSRARGPVPRGTAGGRTADFGDVGPIRAQFQPGTFGGGLVGPSGQPLGTGGGGARVSSGGGGGGGGIISGGGGIRPRGQAFGPAMARETLDELCEKIAVELPLRIGQSTPDVIEVWQCPWGAEYIDPDTLPRGRRLSGGGGGGPAGVGGGSGSGRGRPTSIGLRESNPTRGLVESQPRAGGARSTAGAARTSDPDALRELQAIKRGIDRLGRRDPAASIRGGD